DPGIVMVLLDGGSDDARDADAITAHGGVHVAAIFVEHGEVQRLAVFAAELEHMAHLDPAHDAKRSAVFSAVAFHDLAHVGHHVGLGQVAAPVDPGQVLAGPVGADHEIGHRGDVAIGHHPHLALRADRADEARLAAKVLNDLGLGGHAVAGHAGHARELDVIDLVVAAHQHQHEAVFGHGGHRLDRAL